MTETPPLLFDRRRHAQRLDRAARRGFDGFLRTRAIAGAVESLETILRRFPLAVDLSARDGAFGRALKASGAAGRIDALVEADLSPAMAGSRGGSGLVLDEERLPFAPGAVDLMVSLLSLHWTNDLPGTLSQIRRALKPDGLFLGALLGGATLHELRWALTQAELEITGGAGPRVSPFADAQDGANLLQRAGFALPVSDLDRVVARYADPLRLFADLRAMGETGVLVAGQRPLGRAVLARALELYAERFAGEDGKVPATFEIVSLAGWAPHESQPRPLKPGSAKMSLAETLKVSEIRLPRA